MNLYQKINDYLLRYYPSIWITRVHLFLPIGILLFFVLFGINVFLFPYNVADNFPDTEVGTFLMLIPVLIYLVYWFVFQARYNVEKSGGKLTITQEYLNFTIYYTIYSLALLLILVYSLSSNYKVAHAVSPQELQQDIVILNRGNAVFRGNENSFYKEGKDYVFVTNNYYEPGYSEYYTSSYYPDYEKSVHKVRLEEDELIEVVENFKKVYNKYTNNTITKSAEEIILARLTAQDYISLLPESRYQNSPNYKLGKIERLHYKGWAYPYLQNDFLKLFSALIALLALLTWIFKQIEWRAFVFGMVAILLTPLLLVIMGVVIFKALRLEDYTGFVLGILAYVVLGSIIFTKGIKSKEKNRLALVSTLYLHFFIPFLPFFVWGFFQHKFLRDELDIIYFIGWAIGLLSIGIFKYIYKNIRLKPSKY